LSSGAFSFQTEVICVKKKKGFMVRGAGEHHKAKHHKSKHRKRKGGKKSKK
jgi:hypothetical protein